MTPEEQYEQLVQSLGGAPQRQQPTINGGMGLPPQGVAGAQGMPGAPNGQAMGTLSSLNRLMGGNPSAQFQIPVTPAARPVMPAQQGAPFMDQNVAPRPSGAPTMQTPGMQAIPPNNPQPPALDYSPVMPGQEMATGWQIGT